MIPSNPPWQWHQQEDHPVTTYDVLLGLQPIEVARVPVEAGYDLVPATAGSRAPEVELIELDRRERRCAARRDVRSSTIIFH